MLWERLWRREGQRQEWVGFGFGRGEWCRVGGSCCRGRGWRICRLGGEGRFGIGIVAVVAVGCNMRFGFDWGLEIVVAVAVVGVAMN